MELIKTIQEDIQKKQNEQDELITELHKLLDEYNAKPSIGIISEYGAEDRNVRSEFGAARELAIGAGMDPDEMRFAQQKKDGPKLPPMTWDGRRIPPEKILRVDQESQRVKVRIPGKPRPFWFDYRAEAGKGLVLSNPQMA